LVGLKPENFPTEEQKAVLHSFILKNYADLQPIEIREAFELALDRKLDLTDNELKTFQLFSVEYLSKVMSRYRSYRTKELRKQLNQEVKMIPAPKFDEIIYLRSAFVDKYIEILKGKPFNFNKVDCFVLFNKLESLGIEIADKETRQAAWEDVKSNLDWFEKSARKLEPTQNDAVNQTKYQLFKDWVLSNVMEETDMQQVINNAIANQIES